MHWTTRWSLSILVSFIAIAWIGGCDTREPAPKEEWQFVNPLIEVEVGEWAEYRLVDDKIWRMEVIDDGGRGDIVKISNRQRTIDIGELVGSSEQSIHRNHILNGYESAGWVVGKMYKVTVNVAGRPWDALCVEYLTRDGSQYKVWYTQDVPGFGLLKQVAIRGAEPPMVNAELVNWSSRSEE